MPAPLSGSFNFPRSPGAPAIFGAVMDGDLEAVKTILDKDASEASARDRGGNTPLMMAVLFGEERREIIDLLLANGADVNATNKHGGNALARAATFGHKGLVKQLLALGADASLKDAAGQNAIDWAEKGGHKDIVSILRSSLKSTGLGPKPPSL